jgi:hypothetical protein
MLRRAKDARVDIMMLTVDSITGGNRERDLRTGFSIPFNLTLAGMLQFAIKPMWAINYATHERFRLPQLDEHVDMSGGALSIGRYFTEMLDPSMNWDDVAEMVLGQSLADVCFTPESGHRELSSICPLSANRDLIIGLSRRRKVGSRLHGDLIAACELAHA